MKNCNNDVIAAPSIPSDSTTIVVFESPLSGMSIGSFGEFLNSKVGVDVHSELKTVSYIDISVSNIVVKRVVETTPSTSIVDLVVDNDS